MKYQLHPDSLVIEDRTYYLPTYLHEKNNPDGESWLFLRRIVAWVTKGGKRQVRVATEVVTYLSGDAMVADIDAHPEWVEAPAEADGNPQWIHDGFADQVGEPG